MNTAHLKSLANPSHQRETESPLRRQQKSDRLQVLCFDCYGTLVDYDCELPLRPFFGIPYPVTMTSWHSQNSSTPSLPPPLHAPSQPRPCPSRENLRRYQGRLLARSLDKKVAVQVRAQHFCSAPYFQLITSLAVARARRRLQMFGRKDPLFTGSNSFQRLQSSLRKIRT